MDTAVIGASGLVGSNVVARFRDAGITSTYHTTPTEKASVRIDVTDNRVVSTLITDRASDPVVNAATFHGVDACELERDKAWSVNATGYTEGRHRRCRDRRALSLYLD